MPDPEGRNLPESLEVLIGFLGDEELTTRIARLEHELEGVLVSDIPSLLHTSNVFVGYDDPADEVASPGSEPDSKA